LANDSGTYLVMAQYFAALGDADPVISELYHAETYPPLFPALLAMVGAADDLLRAHWMVTIAFALSCVLLLNLARRSRTVCGWPR